MNPNQTSEILLKAPVGELQVNPALIAFMRENKLNSLGDLLTLAVPEIRKLKGYNPEVFFQLQEFLHQHKMLHLIKEWPTR